MNAQRVRLDLVEIVFRALARQNCIDIYRQELQAAADATDEQKVEFYRANADDYAARAKSNVEQGERACRSLVYQLQCAEPEDRAAWLFGAICELVTEYGLSIDMEKAANA